MLGCGSGGPRFESRQGSFLSLKFLLMRKWTKWRRTTTTTQVIPCSLADGRKQKNDLPALWWSCCRRWPSNFLKKKFSRKLIIWSCFPEFWHWHWKISSCWAKLMKMIFFRKNAFLWSLRSSSNIQMSAPSSDIWSTSSFDNNDPNLDHDKAFCQQWTNNKVLEHF